MTLLQAAPTKSRAIRSRAAVDPLLDGDWLENTARLPELVSEPPSAELDVEPTKRTRSTASCLARIPRIGAWVTLSAVAGTVRFAGFMIFAVAMLADGAARAVMNDEFPSHQ